MKTTSYKDISKSLDNIEDLCVKFPITCLSRLNALEDEASNLQLFEACKALRRISCLRAATLRSI